MNEIKITLSVPGMSEAINNLAEAIRSRGVYAPTGTAPVVVEVAQPKPVEGIPQPLVNPTQPIQQNTETVVPVTAKEDVIPAVPSAPAPTEPSVDYTIEQLGNAGAALCEQGKMPQLIALLGKYGVQAITQLKQTPEVLNSFAAELKALGANL